MQQKKRKLASDLYKKVIRFIEQDCSQKLATQVFNLTKATVNSVAEVLKEREMLVQEKAWVAQAKNR